MANSSLKKIYKTILYLSVGDGLLGQIVVDDECVLAVVSEELSHCTTWVGGQVLQRSSVRRCSWHDDGVLYGSWVSQPLDNLGDGGPLLSNSYVDTVQLLLLVISIVESLLVDDGVDGQSCLTGNFKQNQLYLKFRKHWRCECWLYRS